MDKILVGTHHALVLLDTETSEFNVVDRAKKHHWGITFSPEYLINCQWYGNRTRFQLFDSRFRKRNQIAAPPIIVAPHQITWIEGRLWVVNTQYDIISIYDMRRDYWFHWRHHPDQSIYNKDGLGNDKCHFNGVYRYGDSLYIMAHNRGDYSFCLQYILPTDIPITVPPEEFIKEVKFAEYHSNLGSCSHNYFHVGDDAYGVCSSGEGKIISEEGDTVVVTGGYPRGVAVTKDYYYVGVSPHHFHKCALRNQLDGDVHVYNKNWKLRKIINLKGCGQIFEIRAVNCIDDAHCENWVRMSFKQVPMQKNPDNEVETSIANIKEDYGLLDNRS